MTNMTIDDADPRIQWGPSESDWSTNLRPAFINATLQYVPSSWSVQMPDFLIVAVYSFSSNPDASATVEFSGDAVAIYGTVSPDHADINVNIDGQSTTLNGGFGTVRAVRPQVRYHYQVSCRFLLSNWFIFQDIACQFFVYASFYHHLTPRFNFYSTLRINLGRNSTS